MDKIEILKQLVRQAKEHSPFYKKLYKDMNISEINTLKDFEKLPMISSTDIIEYSADMLPSNVVPYRITSSSGTLGQPKTVYRSKEDTAISVEILEKMLIMAGVSKNDSIFIGQPFDMAHFGYLVFEAAKKIGALSIPVGISVSNEVFVKYVQTYKPSVLCTSMSRLLSIIDLLVSMNIKELPYVKKIILAGEPLKGNGINKIKHYFKTTPYNFYGSEETDGLASDCASHHGLHFFDGYYYIELLEIEGLHPQKPQNRIGEAVITSLYQTATPLIRYRLGDIVEIDTTTQCNCENSSPLIHVLGRAGDSFHIFDGITIMAFQVEQIIRKHIESLNNYQIVVSTLVPGLEEICVYLDVSDQKINEKTGRAIEKDLWNSSFDLEAAHEAGALRFRVDFNKEHIYITKRGKTPKIVDLRIDGGE